MGLLEKVDDAKTSTIALVVHNPYATLQKAQPETAFRNRDVHPNLIITPTWTNEANDGFFREWCLNMKEKVCRNRERRVKGDKDLDDATKLAVGEYSHDNCKLSRRGPVANTEFREDLGGVRGAILE